MSGRLEGKVVFITGAARGQGRSHAVRFAEEGADVIGVDICADIPGTGYPLGTRDDLDETIGLVEKAGGRMVAQGGDVRDRASLEQALDRGVDELGRLDFVLANAGIMPTCGERSQEVRAWTDCLDVMLTGVMNTVEATYPRLIERGEGGVIIMTSSMAAVQPMMRTENAHSLGMMGYAAAKAGVDNLMRNYASFLAPHQIRVNTVQPTGVNTSMIRNEMTEDYFARAEPEDLLTLVSALPVRTLEPVDVSNAMLWLCSDEGRYMSGSTVRLDAGANLR